jgi:hypothetical protein
VRSVLVGIDANGYSSVMVATRSRGRTPGRKLLLSGDTVIVSDRRTRVALPIGEIDSVWTQRSKAGVGFVLGAASCVLVIGLTALSGANSDGGNPIGTGAIITLATLSTAVCGGAGALLGAGVRPWRLEYARPPVQSR